MALKLTPALALAAFLCLPIAAQASDPHYEGNQAYPTTWDFNNAAFQGEAALVVNTKPAFVGRSIKYLCTVSGAITVTYPDGSSGTWILPVTSSEATLPLAVSMLTANTATCSTLRTLR